MNGVRKEVLEELVRMRQWSMLLTQLVTGTAYTIKFPTPEAIESCQTVAYKRNSYRTGRRYRLRTNYEKLEMTITPYEDS